MKAILTVSPYFLLSIFLAFNSILFFEESNFTETIIFLLSSIIFLIIGGAVYVGKIIKNKKQSD